jgi:hypothetical protein
MATGGPNTGETATGYSFSDVKSNTPLTTSAGGPVGTYLKNVVYCRFDDASEPLELIAAIERSKLLMIEQLNKLGR